MTTIATDGRTVAADTQMQGRWRNAIRCQKIHEIGGCIVGGSGEVVEIERFKEWFANGADEQCKPELEDSFEAIVVTPDGACIHFYNKLHPVEVGVPYAIGSGAEFAMGAMLAGASPEEAVEIASLLDTGTNDDVVVLGFEHEEEIVPVSRVALVSGVLPDESVE